MVRMADKASWLAVDKYVADPLCDNDKDDKKWKQAIKEVKEEQTKKKGSGSGYYNRNRGRDGYRSGGRSYRRGDSRDRKSDRYVKDAVDGMEEKCAGRRLEPAMFVGNKAISGRIAEYPRRMGSPEKEASNISRDDFFSTGPDDYTNKDIEKSSI